VDQVYETKLGAVRVAEECGVTGRSSPKRVLKLRDFIDRALKKEVGKPPFVPDMLFGTGGTFTALASIIMARQGLAGQPMWGFRVSRAQIRHLVADLANMSLERRSKVVGLSPQRADIIVAGLAVVERIMRKLGANVVQVHTRGVRDGLMLTMVQQLPTPPSVPTEDRRAAIEEFAKNCGVDLSHARQVARIAGSLWQQLATPLGLMLEDRELIESAALIANVGYLINFDGHHKHSYHLIVNSELPGFERRQLQILANVARYHRGTRPKKRHENLSELSVEDQKRVCELAAILRLALALDRTHQQHVGEVRARVRNDVVRIVVQSEDEANVDLWAAERKVDLFEKVFGRKVCFSARDTGARVRSKRRARPVRPGRGRTNGGSR
jgi:exopolyphosphatase/guanosine-5'-triphosphate,3'-diphosphate pyrophosphatase